MFNSKFLKSVSLQIGTIVGAGILGIPYIIVHAGLFLGFLYLAFLTIIVLLVNLAYSEVILRTKGDHQLTGYGEIYLGKAGKFLGTLALILGSYGALLAYTAQLGKFASLSLNISGAEVFLSLIIFFIGAAAISLGLKRIAALETLIVPGILGIIILIFFLGLSKIRLANFTYTPDSWASAFSPYGVLLFALSGASIIPEVEENLRQEHHLIKKSVVWGTLIPAVIYTFFSLLIIGICGQQTSPDAISGLKSFLPAFIVKTGALLGMMTMFSSFLTLGYVLKEMYYRDFKLNKHLALGLSLLPPLVMFLSGARSFIRILEISGGLMGGITGILIMALFSTAKTKGQKKPPWEINLAPLLIVLTGTVFALGTIYEIIKIIY